MAITLKSAQQVNPGGCKHYRLEIDWDGIIETKVIHLDDLKEVQTDPALLLVKRFVEEKGIALPDLAGKVLVEDAPKLAPEVEPVKLLEVSSEGFIMRTARRFVNWVVG